MISLGAGVLGRVLEGSWGRLGNLWGRFLAVLGALGGPWAALGGSRGALGLPLPLAPALEQHGWCLPNRPFAFLTQHTYRILARGFSVKVERGLAAYRALLVL